MLRTKYKYIIRKMFNISNKETWKIINGFRTAFYSFQIRNNIFLPKFYFIHMFFKNIIFSPLQKRWLAPPMGKMYKIPQPVALLYRVLT